MNFNVISGTLALVFTLSLSTNAFAAAATAKITLSCTNGISAAADDDGVQPVGMPGENYFYCTGLITEQQCANFSHLFLASGGSTGCTSEHYQPLGSSGTTGRCTIGCVSSADGGTFYGIPTIGKPTYSLPNPATVYGQAVNALNAFVNQ